MHNEQMHDEECLMNDGYFVSMFYQNDECREAFSEGRCERFCVLVPRAAYHHGGLGALRCADSRDGALLSFAMPVMCHG